MRIGIKIPRLERDVKILRMKLPTISSGNWYQYHSVCTGAVSSTTKGVIDIGRL